MQHLGMAVEGSWVRRMGDSRWWLVSRILDDGSIVVHRRGPPVIWHDRFVQVANPVERQGASVQPWEIDADGVLRYSLR